MARYPVLQDLAAHDGSAVVTGSDALTWPHLCDLVERLASVIAARVRPAGRVGIAGANTPETLVCYLAAFVSGRSPVGINPRLVRDEIAYLVADADVELLLGSAAVLDTLSEGGPLLGVGAELFWGREGIHVDRSWDAAVEEASPEESGTAPDVAPAPPLLYTSGTSGRPKGTEVRWVADPGPTAAAYWERLVASVDHLPDGPHQVAGPLYHNGPLLAVRALMSGRTVVLPPRFDAETFLALVAEHRSASSVVVPTHLIRLLALPQDVRDRYDVSSLTKVIVTGAACPQETKRAVIQWWGPVLDEAYGGTESGTVCRIDSTEWLARPGSVGQALPGYELLIVDAGDQPVPPGVPGRIFVRDASGRGVQYHNAPEKTRAVHLGPGVFTLGDVGYVDEQGYLYITDRDVDMVVSGGVNIYPAEVERVLIEHPAVSDVAVLGVPHPDMGEELRALVAVRPGAPTPTAAELEQFCRARLAGYKCPRHYEVVEALPRDAMGKLNKRRLRQDFWPETRTVGG